MEIILGFYKSAALEATVRVLGLPL